MTDKELLELAAKAEGYTLVWGGTYGLGDTVVDCTDLPYIKSKDTDVADVYWNPHEDDGDALRLAVKLNIHITISEYKRTVCRQGHEFRTLEDHAADPYAATRRAIVRAAAEIGKTITP